MWIVNDFFVIGVGHLNIEWTETIDWSRNKNEEEKKQIFTTHLILRKLSGGATTISSTTTMLNVTIETLNNCVMGCNFLNLSPIDDARDEFSFTNFKHFVKWKSQWTIRCVMGGKEKETIILYNMKDVLFLVLNGTVTRSIPNEQYINYFVTFSVTASLFSSFSSRGLKFLLFFLRQMKFMSRASKTFKEDSL